MKIEDYIRLALEEDIGSGDHTTRACIAPEQIGRAKLLVKADGILAGMSTAMQVLTRVDPKLELRAMRTDGDRILAGEVILEVTGSVASILQGERLFLNILQRMSGIATRTRAWSDEIAHTACRLMDTRKTTPLHRAMEKEAVRCGGGVNHRMGLYDAILIKDNHVDACGGIREALEAVRKYLEREGLQIPVIAEVRNLDELRIALQAGRMDRVLLDNFSVPNLREALTVMRNHATDGAESIPATEASGNIRLENLVEYAETGVDFLSVGALTHSVEALDLSLKISEVQRH
jgi:nicotinate-nucleotide pyrophosphorylase (carboxylating)